MIWAYWTLMVVAVLAQLYHYVVIPWVDEHDRRTRKLWHDLAREHELNELRCRMREQDTNPHTKEQQQ